MNGEQIKFTGRNLDPLESGKRWHLYITGEYKFSSALFYETGIDNYSNTFEPGAGKFRKNFFRIHASDLLIRLLWKKLPVTAIKDIVMKPQSL